MNVLSVNSKETTSLATHTKDSAQTLTNVAQKLETFVKQFES